MGNTDISFSGLGFAYLMFLFPFSILYWLKIPMISRSLQSVARMTLQLLFIGFYLQFIFKLNNPFLTLSWILVMIIVADVSVIKGSNLHWKKIWFEVFCGLSLGTIIPLLVFLLLVLDLENFLDARILIPICGMIMGNCLRAQLVAIQMFYEDVMKMEKLYLLRLSQGASLKEALLPFLQKSVESSLKPTIAAMSTTGIVALPGMMTGVILGGGSPIMAIKYQIAIMIAIFTGTALSVFLVLFLGIYKNFTQSGILDRDIFSTKEK